MNRANDGIIVFVVCLLLISSVGGLALGEVGEEGSSFPYQDATVVYTVEGSSPMGHLIGTSTYTVEEVTDKGYTVHVEHTGNLSRLPTFGGPQTESLGLDEPISFSSVIGEAELLDSRIVEMGGREMRVNEYFLETEKEYGTETISVFMPEQVKVPLIFDYKYGDRFQIHIELARTNVSYLK